MQKVVDLMNDMCRVLISMEQVGINIDVNALEKLENEYTNELAILTDKLEASAKNTLGDAPFKLTSNKHLSALIFSRIPLCKDQWAEEFNLGTEFVNGVRKPKKPIHLKPPVLQRKIERYSYVTYKKTARQCMACKGKGKVSKRLKSGAWGKPRHNCDICNGFGIDYKVDMNKI